MLNNIRILCAFAALNVVLFHILGASAAQGLAPHSLQFLQGWGECGVDVFFVISGFAVIVWGAAASRQIDNRAPAYLGAASYGIYLMQVLALPTFYKPAAGSPGLVLIDVLALAALTVATLSGCLRHQYVEESVAAWLKARRPGIRLQLR